MSFHPCFRTIHVEPVKNEEAAKKTKVMLPDGAVDDGVKYTKCRVIEFSKDCIISKGLDLSMRDKDRFVVVESHLIEKIDVDGEEYYLVPETAVRMVSSV